MVSTIQHRGPDDEGIWSDGTCGLAHARLAVIDLSPGGHQPMTNASGQVWITYNDPEYLQKRHGIPPELMKNLAGAGALLQRAVE